jgi:hypothetical protein
MSGPGTARTILLFHIISDRPPKHPRMVQSFPPSSLRRRWRVVSWADILLDVICGVENSMREGCPGTMTGVSQYS